jgi:hypothetical protein
LKLKFELLLLSVGTALPLAIFAVVAVFALIDHQRSTMQQEAMGRVASVMSAIDAEVNGSIMTLQALAASENFEGGDFRSFHDKRGASGDGDGAVSSLAVTPCAGNSVWGRAYPGPRCRRPRRGGSGRRSSGIAVTCGRRSPQAGG